MDTIYCLVYKTGDRKRVKSGVVYMPVIPTLKGLRQTEASLSYIMNKPVSKTKPSQIQREEPIPQHSEDGGRELINTRSSSHTGWV